MKKYNRQLKNEKKANYDYYSADNNNDFNDYNVMNRKKVVEVKGVTREI